MAETNYNNQNNPSGIWQTIWLKLIMEAIEEIINGNYVKSYLIMQILQQELPPDCETDTAEKYKEIEKIYQKGFEIKASDYVTAQTKQSAYFSKNLRTPLLTLLGTVRTSLFKNGWIHKDFTVRPRSGTAHISGEPTQ